MADDTPRPTTVRLARDRIVDRLQQLARRASLQVIDGAAADLGAHEPVDHPLIIGRGEEATFRIRDDGASRQHAWVGWDDQSGGFVVRDMGSTNGTFVNGEQIGQQILTHGDKIGIASTVLEFRMADDQEIVNREKIEGWLSTDELTGLPNKRRFDGELRRVVGTAVEGVWLAVLMLDMDNLKGINDSWGHHVGSRAITEVGKLIGRIVRGRGSATRFGGDEFTIYLVGHDLAAGKAVGELIRKAVEELDIPTDTSTIRSSISIGVAARPCRGMDPEALCREADNALYRAKAKGRNCVSD